MAHDYASDGYKDCRLIWSGNWNKRQISLYIWRKIDPDRYGVWSYAIDVRNKYDETLNLDNREINHLLAETIYQVISGELAIEEAKPISKDRFSMLFGDD